MTLDEKIDFLIEEQKKANQKLALLFAILNTKDKGYLNSSIAPVVVEENKLTDETVSAPVDEKVKEINPKIAELFEKIIERNK